VINIISTIFPLVCISLFFVSLNNEKKNLKSVDDNDNIIQFKVSPVLKNTMLVCSIFWLICMIFFTVLTIIGEDMFFCIILFFVIFVLNLALYIACLKVIIYNKLEKKFEIRKIFSIKDYNISEISKVINHKINCEYYFYIDDKKVFTIEHSSSNVDKLLFILKENDILMEDK